LSPEPDFFKPLRVKHLSAPLNARSTNNDYWTVWLDIRVGDRFAVRRRMDVFL
jgi:hypothetical protein